MARAEVRQQAILETVERLGLSLGRPVTPAEVATALGYKLSTVHYHVRILSNAGRLDRLFRGSGLQIPAGGSAAAPLARAEHPTDAAIIAFIRRRMVGTSSCPTVPEIAAALAVSQSTVRRHLKALREAGRITHTDIFREGARREYCIVETTTDGANP